MRHRTQERVRAGLGYGLGGMFVFLLVLPLIWVVSTSVRPISEMTQTPPLVWPQSLTFDAYFDIWDEAPFVRYFRTAPGFRWRPP